MDIILIIIFSINQTSRKETLVIHLAAPHFRDHHVHFIWQYGHFLSTLLEAPPPRYFRRTNWVSDWNDVLWNFFGIYNFQLAPPKVWTQEHFACWSYDNVGRYCRLWSAGINRE